MAQFRERVSDLPKVNHQCQDWNSNLSLLTLTTLNVNLMLTLNILSIMAHFTSLLLNDGKEQGEPVILNMSLFWYGFVINRFKQFWCYCVLHPRWYGPTLHSKGPGKSPSEYSQRTNASFFIEQQCTKVRWIPPPGSRNDHDMCKVITIISMTRLVLAMNYKEISVGDLWERSSSLTKKKKASNQILFYTPARQRLGTSLLLPAFWYFYDEKMLW